MLNKEGDTPRPKFKLTQVEALGHREQLRQLKEMGLAVGCAGDFTKPREQLRLEQVDVELATIRALPGSGYVFVAPAKLTVLASSVLITDFEMTAPWDELPLELDEPETFPCYGKVVAGLYPLTFLNAWLTGKRPLRRSQREGLVMGWGQTSVPPEYGNYEPLSISLSLWDHKKNEFRFALRGRLDLSLRIAYQRRLERRSSHERVRQPLFGPKPDGGSEKRVSQIQRPFFRLPDKDDVDDRDISYNDIHSTDEMKRWQAALKVALANSVANATQ